MPSSQTLPANVSPSCDQALENSVLSSSHHALISTERAVLWEVNLARRCLENFSKVIDAHAIVMCLLVTVTFVGFLQPPKGWDVDSQNKSQMFASPSVVAFTVFNSLCLFSAISGLLFYIYCSYSTIFTLGSVPIPERLDARGMAVVHQLRSALRRVALPTVQRRSTILFGFLSSSLICCVAAYISAGLAAMGPSNGLRAAVILPAIPGLFIIFFFLLLSAAKMSMELKFDERLRMFWKIADAKEPDIPTLDAEVMQALDPMPELLRKIIKVIWPEIPCRPRYHGDEISIGNPWEMLDRGNKVVPCS